MKIRLFYQHRGLMEMLRDLFEDHTVVWTDVYPTGDFEEVTK